MVFKKTQSALLVALALQQFYGSAYAETVTPAGSAAGNKQTEQLPEVKVTGSAVDTDYAPGVSSVGGKTLTAIRDIPQSVTVVNRAVLDSQGVASLQEALRNVP